MTTSPPPDLSGTVIADRYKVERLIGQGGMGTVWAGRHVTLGQLVAIKFVHPKFSSSREALRRFDTEAKAAARIKSRHAVAVHDHGVTAQGQPYIVMEYLEGESLEQRIRRAGALPLEAVVEIVSQATRALEVAHQAGIVHRDLKPDNVFLAADREVGRGYTVKLLDFGIAKIAQDEASAGASATQAGAVLGTPHYMAPEALTASQPVGPASDVWSLGACAFAAACGRVPFEGDAIGDVVLKVCAAPLPVPSEVNPLLPPAFDDWFRKACEREPGKRFASVREMADALVRLEQWSGAERERSAYEIRPKQLSALELELQALEPAPRGRMLAGILVGIAVTIGVLGYYVVRQTERANLAIEASVASARAAMEAQNEAKLREAEERFRQEQAAEADAGQKGSALDAGVDTGWPRAPTRPFRRVPGQADPRILPHR
jgi:serine/threonine protein kinase